MGRSPLCWHLKMSLRGEPSSSLHHRTWTPEPPHKLSRLPSNTVPLTTCIQAPPFPTTSSSLSSPSNLTPSLSPLLTHRQISNSSDSDSPGLTATSCFLMTMNPIINPLYAHVEVLQHSPNTAPVLSAGCLTIQVLRQFENACRCYISQWKILPKTSVVT